MVLPHDCQLGMAVRGTELWAKAVSMALKPQLQQLKRCGLARLAMKFGVCLLHAWPCRLCLAAIANCYLPGIHVFHLGVSIC